MIRPCNGAAKVFARTRPEGQQLAVTAGTSDGVLHGTITVERYLISSRMLMIDNPPLEFEQRRESFRVSVVLPITLGLPRGDELVLIVRDRGPGVAEDQLAHLAEPFFRTDSARQRATGGVGLGLYLCRLVAQAHGGSLGIRNAEPGLAVSVNLPLRAGPMV